MSKKESFEEFSKRMQYHRADCLSATDKALRAQQNLSDAYLEFGKTVERERIIKLLEELRSEFRTQTSPDDSDVVNMCLALIKGENK